MRFIPAKEQTLSTDKAMFRAKGLRRVQAAQPDQRRLDRLVERCVRLCADNRGEASVIHTQRHSP